MVNARIEKNIPVAGISFAAFCTLYVVEPRIAQQFRGRIDREAF